MSFAYVRLPFRNAYNIRDLGGYSCGPGKATKWGAFLRADDLGWLERDEIDFLKSYGITTVIDLRGASEIESLPDPFKAEEGVDYHSIPFMTKAITDITRVLDETPASFLENFYIELLKHGQEAVKEIFETIAKSQGSVLFHCTAGKDRTGVIAMLLLGLAGVAEPDIVANYEITYTYFKRNPIIQKVDPSLNVLYSKSEFIEKAISYINDSFGNVPQYLESAGVSHETMRVIVDKLTQSV
ncbi:MAG: tyrosine-protein phosphatase [Clostridiales bacterium]|nr:tyrosine-protein phosphatase [Clostridiales bacterium]